MKPKKNRDNFALSYKKVGHPFVNPKTLLNFALLYF